MKAHKVLIADEALQAAAQLSARYLSGRQLPDKAIDLLDTAAARVALNQSAPPRAITQLQDRIGQRTLEIEQLERQSLIGLGEHAERLALLHSEQRDATQRIQSVGEAVAKATDPGAADHHTAASIFGGRVRPPGGILS